MFDVVFLLFPWAFSTFLQVLPSVSSFGPYETWTLFRGTGPITVKLSKKNHCIADTFIADDVMEDTVFLVPREKFKPNLFSIAGTPHFLWKIKINCYFFSKCFYLTHFSTLHLVSYLISLNLSFLSQVVTLQSRELRVSQ